MSGRGWNSEYFGLGDVEDFKEACANNAWFYHERWISLQTAVDNCQHLAEIWGLVDEIGQDEVQRLTAGCDDVAPPALSAYESTYVQRIIAQWEAADIQPVPIPKAAQPAYRTPQSTIDAFWFVVGTGNADRLAAWLKDHPADAPHLHKIWGRKCSTVAA